MLEDWHCLSGHGHQDHWKQRRVRIDLGMRLETKIFSSQSHTYPSRLCIHSCLGFLFFLVFHCGQHPAPSNISSTGKSPFYSIPFEGNIHLADVHLQGMDENCSPILIIIRHILCFTQSQNHQSWKRPSKSSSADCHNHPWAISPRSTPRSLSNTSTLTPPPLWASYSSAWPFFQRKIFKHLIWTSPGINKGHCLMAFHFSYERRPTPTSLQPPLEKLQRAMRFCRSLLLFKTKQLLLSSQASPTFIWLQDCQARWGPVLLLHKKQTNRRWKDQETTRRAWTIDSHVRSWQLS